MHRRLDGPRHGVLFKGAGQRRGRLRREEREGRKRGREVKLSSGREKGGDNKHILVEERLGYGVCCDVVEVVFICYVV